MYDDVWVWTPNLRFTRKMLNKSLQTCLQLCEAVLGHSSALSQILMAGFEHGAQSISEGCELLQSISEKSLGSILCSWWIFVQNLRATHPSIRHILMHKKKRQVHMVSFLWNTPILTRFPFNLSCILSNWSLLLSPSHPAILRTTGHTRPRCQPVLRAALSTRSAVPGSK